LRILEKLNGEYQSAVWRAGGGGGGGRTPGAGAGEGAGGAAHYTAGGRVCLFELRPRAAPCQALSLSAGSSGGEALIPERDLERLSGLLFGSEGGSRLSDFQCPVTSLLLLSPLPLVLADMYRREGVAGWSGDGGGGGGGGGGSSGQLAYSPGEVARVLDLVTRWLAEDPYTHSPAAAAGAGAGAGADNGAASDSFSTKREVFFVCGGSRINYSSVIRCEDFGENRGKSSEQLCVKQLYCGPFVGAAPDLDGSGAGRGSEGDFAEGRFVVTSAHSARRYSVTTIRASAAAQVGVVTAAEKTQQGGEEGEGEGGAAPASASAGCFHLGLHDLKSDAGALGHDYLPAEVLAVWDMVREYTARYAAHAAGPAPPPGPRHVKGKAQGQGPAPEQGDMVSVVAVAALRVFRALQQGGALAECHEGLRKGVFGGVSHEEDVSVNAAGAGAGAAEGHGQAQAQAALPDGQVGGSQGALLGAVSAFLLARLPAGMQAVFPGAPSQLVMRLVWEEFAAGQGQPDAALGKAFGQIGAAVRRDDLLFASLCRDLPQFSRLCFSSLLALAAFPHCALALGLNDGW
jgi:hypothetical protein